MRKSLFSVLLAAGVAAVPLAAQAMPLMGDQLAARIVNAEFRGYATTNRGYENQIWHFLPDGRIRAVASAQKLLALRADRHLEWQDIGAWTIQGGSICVTFSGLNRDLNGCYSVDVGFRTQARLIGPYMWQGTLERYD